MKTNLKLLCILICLAIIAGCSSGCTAMSAARENIDAAAVIETAATAASGDYGSTLAALAKLVKRKKQAEMDIMALMTGAGYSYILQLFFDGAEITDHSRFSHKEGFYRTGTGKDSVMLATGGGYPAATLGPEFDDAVDDFAKKLIKSGAVKE